MRGSYQVAFGNDPDADRHGIVVPGPGLLNPNHYLAVAIRYLFSHRPSWPQQAAVGKTLVSSAIIDRVAAALGRDLREVPVGFKWFVDGLLDGSLGFGGEESAGASFLRFDGSDVDHGQGRPHPGAAGGRDHRDARARIRASTTQKSRPPHGAPVYTRVDQPATPSEKAKLKQLSPAQVKSSSLAGEPIRAILTKAPSNGAAIGGLKVVAENGWFAARPSGTENVYKVYAESFCGEAHLAQILAEARAIVQAALAEPRIS